MSHVAPKMFYFGPVRTAGHHFWDESLTHIISVYPHPEVPWKEVDGGLCPGSVPGRPYERTRAEVEGEALLHHKDGWTALSFWDRSVDRRHGCNSNYFAYGTFTFEDMVRMAKARFAERWNVMKFEVKLVVEGDAKGS